MTYTEEKVPFTAYVTIAEKRALESAAKDAGKTRASYVRDVLAAHLASTPVQKAAA